MVFVSYCKQYTRQADCAARPTKVCPVCAVCAVCLPARAAVPRGLQRLPLSMDSTDAESLSRVERLLLQRLESAYVTRDEYRQSLLRLEKRLTALEERYAQSTDDVNELHTMTAQCKPSATTAQPVALSGPLSITMAADCPLQVVAPCQSTVRRRRAPKATTAAIPASPTPGPPRSASLPKRPKTSAVDSVPADARDVQ